MANYRKFSPDDIANNALGILCAIPGAQPCPPCPTPTSPARHASKSSTLCLTLRAPYLIPASRPGYTYAIESIIASLRIRARGLSVVITHDPTPEAPRAVRVAIFVNRTNAPLLHTIYARISQSTPGTVVNASALPLQATID